MTYSRYITEVKIHAYAVDEQLYNSDTDRLLLDKRPTHQLNIVNKWYSISNFGLGFWIGIALRSPATTCRTETVSFIRSLQNESVL